MKKPQCIEEQILTVLKEASAGMKPRVFYHKHGIPNVTDCQWRSKWGRCEDLGVSSD